MKPGGSLLVVDFLKGSARSVSETILRNVGHAVPHHGGFDEADMGATFTRAELEGFEFKLLTSIKFHGEDTDVFLARGMKGESIGDTQS